MRRTGRFVVATGVVATAIAALIGLPYTRELQRARDALGLGSVIAHTASGPIEYAEQGVGFPLLSIHGAGGGYDQGLSNVAALIGDGFRVVAPSRFGYLRTPIPGDASPAKQADAHAALLDELDIPKAVVIGVSAGARSALELAIRHPDRVAALVLLVPGTYSPANPVSIEASRGSRLAFWLVNNGADFAWWAMEKIAPSVLIRFIGVPPELVAASSKPERERVISLVRSIQPLSMRVAGINLDSIPDLQPLPLETVSAPTLIVSARDDLFNTAPAAEFAASRIPNAKLIIYETGGHLMISHDAEVRSAVRAFLTTARTKHLSDVEDPTDKGPT